MSFKLGAQVLKERSDARGLPQIGVREEPNRSRALFRKSLDEYQLRMCPGLREPDYAHAEVRAERRERPRGAENPRRNGPSLRALRIPNEGGLVPERARPLEETMHRVTRIAAKPLDIGSRREESNARVSDLSPKQVFGWVLSDTNGDIGLMPIQATDLIAQVEIEGDGRMLSLKPAEESAHGLRNHFGSGDSQGPFDSLVMTCHPPLQCLNAAIETRTKLFDFFARLRQAEPSRVPFEELRRESRFQLCDAPRNSGRVHPERQRRLPHRFPFAHSEENLQIVPDDTVGEGGRQLLR